VAAMTGGASISDVTINGNVISIFGSDAESGTGTLQAKGTSESRIDLNLSGGTRTDVRNATGGIPAGAWSKNGSTATAYAQHNSWTDAAWFFPVLSSLSQTGAAKFVFSYVGLEQHGGVSAQHIRVFQLPSGVTDLRTAQRLSTVEFYLDPVSYLPLAVGFNTHADNDLNTDIPTETRFANYQTVNGIQFPFHIQRMLNGGVVLDVTVTNVSFNTGLLDSLFTLP
jgi:hypothetical protein